MRIVNQNITVKGVIFSKPAGFIYFLMFIFFVYKCLLLLPIWLTVKDKAETAKAEYNKKILLAEERVEEIKNKETSLGKERYQKDFFNKLDEGEYLIVLYNEEKEKKEENLEVRKMFWWEEAQQDFLVWWKNL